MTTKVSQPMPEGTIRPPAPAAPPKIVRRKFTRDDRIEALETMLRQEKSNALYWHDKYAATLPTSEPQRERAKSPWTLMFAAAIILAFALAGLLIRYV